MHALHAHTTQGTLAGLRERIVDDDFKALLRVMEALQALKKDAAVSLVVDRARAILRCARLFDA